MVRFSPSSTNEYATKALFTFITITLSYRFWLFCCCPKEHMRFSEVEIFSFISGVIRKKQKNLFDIIIYDIENILSEIN